MGWALRVASPFVLKVCIVHATARTTWGEAMTVHSEIAPSGRGTRAVLRIAIPSFGQERRIAEPRPSPMPPTREEFKRLLDGALQPADLLQLRLTRSERRQLSIARRVRSALYDSPLGV